MLPGLAEMTATLLMFPSVISRLPLIVGFPVRLIAEEPVNVIVGEVRLRLPPALDEVILILLVLLSRFKFPPNLL